MCFIYPEKIEIELFPEALEVMEKIQRETGVSKSELIEKMFLKYVPYTAERAVEVVLDDIATRTVQLTYEDKKLYIKQS